jgi:hypothetical protein
MSIVCSGPTRGSVLRFLYAKGHSSPSSPIEPHTILLPALSQWVINIGLAQDSASASAFLEGLQEKEMAEETKVRYHLFNIPFSDLRKQLFTNMFVYETLNDITLRCSLSVFLSLSRSLPLSLCRLVQLCTISSSYCR